MGKATRTPENISSRNFQLNPAKKITANPEANTRIEVPKSGCFKIKATGSASITKATK